MCLKTIHVYRHHADLTQNVTMVSVHVYPNIMEILTQAVGQNVYCIQIALEIAPVYNTNVLILVQERALLMPFAKL